VGVLFARDTRDGSLESEKQIKGRRELIVFAILILGNGKKRGSGSLGRNYQSRGRSRSLGWVWIRRPRRQ
jgi:hypothetical protein